MAMTSSATCRDCGVPLSTGSMGGFCPKCMLGLALEASDRKKESPQGSQPAAAHGDADAGGDHPDAEPGGGGEGRTVRDQIAGYRLLEEIGEGGCGVVYMAEQEKPVYRKVAVKVIKIGMDTRQVVARFEAERQALARMDHPNIARFLDAG